MLTLLSHPSDSFGEGKEQQCLKRGWGVVAGWGGGGTHENRNRERTGVGLKIAECGFSVAAG